MNAEIFLEFSNILVLQRFCSFKEAAPELNASFVLPSSQGVNRAFPYVSSAEADDIIEVQTPMIFQLVISWSTDCKRTLFSAVTWLLIDWQMAIAGFWCALISIHAHDCAGSLQEFQCGDSGIDAS